MKKIIVLLFSTFLVCSTEAQPVVFINAGSRASYGQYQELTIEVNGTCHYYLSQVNGTTKDSSVFTIGRLQLDSLFQKVEDAGFFKLNAKYDSGAKDGAGIFISINNSGKKHNVSLINTDIPAINEIISWLNSVLSPQKIRIYYGQNTGK